MKFLIVFIRMAQIFLPIVWAYLFYPVMVGLFLWLYIKGTHWIYGLAVIVAILLIDPIWRVLAANMLKSICNLGQK